MSHDGQALALPVAVGAPALRAVCATYLPAVEIGVAVDDTNPAVLAIDLRGLPQSSWYVRNTGGNPIVAGSIGWWVNDLEWIDPFPGGVLPIAPGGVLVLDWRRNATGGRLYLAAGVGAPTTADVACVASGV